MYNNDQLGIRHLLPISVSLTSATLGELILPSELVGVPISSQCDLPPTDHNLQEHNMSNSKPLPSTDLQTAYRGSVFMCKNLRDNDGRRTSMMLGDIFLLTQGKYDWRGGLRRTVPIIDFGIQLKPRHKRDGNVGSVSTVC